MDLCYQSCCYGRLLCVRPSIWRGPNFDGEHYTHFFKKPKSAITATRIGTIGPYHIIPLAVALDFAEGHKVSESTGCWFHVSALFSTDPDEI